MDIQEVRFVATESRGEVSGLLVRPRAAWAMLVLGHGAGAGMEHPFMRSIAQTLGEHGIATLRYCFPYIEAGRKRPDAGAVLEATTRSAVTFAAGLVPALPRFAGGKSMGGGWRRALRLPAVLMPKESCSSVLRCTRAAGLAWSGPST